jgi:putative SOS response-associated peptidase YedK
MCGRYILLRPNDLFERFGVSNWLEDLLDNADVRPTQFSPVIGMDRRAELMRWGLVPAWAKDPAMGAKLINARAETLAEKPSFRRPLRSGRCLIPATGFYEWQASPTGRGKTKMLFTRADGDMFGFAGLCDVWRDPSGRELKTYTIVTTAPNAVVAPVHDRMPVILTRETEEVWLDPDEHDPQNLIPCLLPLPAEELIAQAA